MPVFVISLFMYVCCGTLLMSEVAGHAIQQKQKWVLARAFSSDISWKKFKVTNGNSKVIAREDAADEDSDKQRGLGVSGIPGMLSRKTRSHGTASFLTPWAELCIAYGICQNSKIKKQRNAS